MPVLPDNDVKAIEELHRRWIDEELSGNALAVLGLCTDQVIWIPADGPALRGQEAVRNWLGRLGGEIKSLKITNRVIDGSGSVAYLVADYSTVFRAEGSVESTVMQGTHFWLVHRLDGGDWRVAVVTWSS